MVFLVDNESGVDSATDLSQGVAQRLGKYVKGIEDPDQTSLRADKLGVKVRI